MPRDLPNPGIEPGSPAFQVDSLPAELPGKIVHDIKKRGEKSLPSIPYSIGFGFPLFEHPLESGSLTRLSHPRAQGGVAEPFPSASLACHTSTLLACLEY